MYVVVVRVYVLCSIGYPRVRTGHRFFRKFVLSFFFSGFFLSARGLVDPSSSFSSLLLRSRTPNFSHSRTSNFSHTPGSFSRSFLALLGPSPIPVLTRAAGTNTSIPQVLYFGRLAHKAGRERMDRVYGHCRSLRRGDLTSPLGAGQNPGSGGFGLGLGRSHPHGRCRKKNAARREKKFSVFMHQHRLE